MIKKQAIQTVVNSWASDGHPYMLKNNKIVRVYPNKDIARKLISNGAVSDWVDDEVSYLKSLT